MGHEAVFFDRDNTLLYGDPALKAERNARIEGWTGAPFSVRPEEMMELFFATRPEQGWKSVEEEVAAQRRSRPGDGKWRIQSLLELEGYLEFGRASG